MKTQKLSFPTSFILLVMILLVGCGGKKGDNKAPFDPVGDWNYKVTTDVSYGVLSISGQKGKYKASMTTEVFGTLELMQLKIEGTKLSADLDVGGTPAKITCDFDGDEMTGAVVAGDTKFPFIGERDK